jgi:hypothetical protein
VKRESSLDVLKFVLCFFVVGIHAGFLVELGEIYNFFSSHGLFRIAVPMFLLINGYYLPVLFKNSVGFSWVKKFFCVYFFWMFFYSYFWLSSDFINNMFFLFFGYHHLWYLSGLILSACLLFLVRGLSSRFLFVFSCLFYFFGAFLQYLCGYGFIADLGFREVFLYRNFLFFCFPFVCLGYIISRHEFFIRYKLICLFSLFFFILFVVEVGFNYVNYLRVGVFDFYLILFLFCPSFFLVVKGVEFDFDSKFLAKVSAAIFFVHSFSLSLLWKLGFENGTLLTVFVMLLSFFFAFFIINLSKKFSFLL